MLKAIGYILLSGVVFAMNILPEIAKGRCAGKWKDSGLTAEFKFGTGCVVDIDGRWIPEAKRSNSSEQFKLRHYPRPNRRRLTLSIKRASKGVPSG
jgi:hypothetical protein